MMEHGQPGDRLRVTFLADPYTDLPIVSTGTVSLNDSTGTDHVRPDRGNFPGLVPDEDM